MLRDRSSVLRRLQEDIGLTAEEADTYIEALEKGSILPGRGRDVKRLLEKGMMILSGDNKNYIPVHPRLAVAGQYRVWRERMVREINEKRMRVDRLILELIPLYEATTERRLRREEVREKR